jgi:hypothetical protein
VVLVTPPGVADCYYPELTMGTSLEAHKKVFIEVISNSDDVRAEYLAKFRDEANGFSLAMSQALTFWHKLEFAEEEAAVGSAVSSLVYSGIMLHIQSMKLFLSGCPVAAGNLSRQVIDTVALALLCSSRELDIGSRFLADSYNATDAVRDLRLHQETLKLSPGTIQCLEVCQRFYHLYSHPTKMTVASYMSYSDAGLYIGAAFDEGKLDFYAREIDCRVKLAEYFPGIVQKIRSNLKKH